MWTQTRAWAREQSCIDCGEDRDECLTGDICEDCLQELCDDCARRYDKVQCDRCYADEIIDSAERLD